MPSEITRNDLDKIVSRYNGNYSSIEAGELNKLANPSIDTLNSVRDVANGYGISNNAKEKKVWRKN